MESTTGTFGSLNFGVPVRLLSDAAMARHWGAQAFRTAHAEKNLFPNFDAPPTAREGISNTYSMLALRPLADGEPKTTVNGVVCMAYSDHELAAARRFYSRFGNAMLARLPVSHFEQVSWQILPQVDWVYCVVTTDAAFSSPSYTSPILQTYLDAICTEFLAYGDDFCEEFLLSTRRWSTYWLDNRTEDLCTALDNADAEADNEVVDAVLKKSAPGLNQRNNITAYCLKPQQSSETDILPSKETIFSGNIEQSNTKYFCFGMGSLINTPSRVGTGGKVTQCAIPVAVNAKYDFCPCWNFQNRAGGSQLTAGGMVMRNDPRNQNPQAKTAGVVYPGPSDDEKMKEQDEREVGYTRYNIPLECIESMNWCKIPDGITIFQYVPNTELPDDHEARAKGSDGKPTPRAPFPIREYPLPQTYVDVCITGCLEYNETFAATWIAGFVGWPDESRPYWLNDRPMPRTPWVEQQKYREVDGILMSEIPESFKCRSLPAEYALLYTGDAEKNTDISYISYKKASRKPVRAKDQEPKFFIFEYDDRISFEQWQKVTCAADIEQGIACRLLPTAGYRRSFCHPVEGSSCFTAPSLRKDAAGSRDVNGVLYAAPGKWLNDGGVPDEKDDIFVGNNMKRVRLNNDDFHVLANFMAIPSNAKIFTYMTAQPRAPSYEFPIRQSVIDTILGGCMEHSVNEDFTAEWVDTTDGWKNKNGKCYWLNDRVIPRRPWVALGGSYKIFDRLVFESTSEWVPQGVLLERRLPVEFVLNLK